MPCYTVQLVSVVFKAKHKDVLKAAAKQLNWSYEESERWPHVYVGGMKIDLERESQTVRADQVPALNKLRQTYSYCALKKLERQKSWKLFKNPQKQNAFVLQKF